MEAWLAKSGEAYEAFDNTQTQQIIREHVFARKNSN